MDPIINPFEAYDFAQLSRAREKEELGTQVWCDGQLIGHLKHRPFIGNTLSLAIADHDVSDFAFEGIREIDVELEVRRINLRLRTRFTAWSRDTIELSHNPEHIIATLRQREHVPVNAVMEDRPQDCSVRLSWSAFDVSLDESELLFDLDEFAPFGR